MCDVSIIIVNYNTVKLTKACIESVIKNSLSNIIEIIVVDNGSLDESKKTFISDESINYIYLNENIGFGPANNLGAEVAKGKYLFFLNSDTLLIGDALSKLVLFAESNLDKNIGAVGTCLIDESGKDNLSFMPFVSAKRIYLRFVQEFLRLRNNNQANVYRKIKENYFTKVDVISGANLFVPKYVFDKLIGFDSDFFMYYEESELQKRMALLEFDRYIINERLIIHYDGGSFENKGMSVKKILMINNGLKLYIIKHFDGFNKRHIQFLSFLILIRDLFRYKYSISHKIAIIKTFIFQ